ncbi:NF-kappa-B-repressing factor [Leptodactylus fuscus]|uniref:NF-kappa-B-repressing factor n=1 Tax=Leptodactylus fuscus TaxID=238119 RepID=UPI003F4E58F1
MPRTKRVAMETGEETSVSLDDYRLYQENDRHWASRREFLARHLHEYPGRKMDQLISLSVVWSNMVFIGNRYSPQVTEKVHQMGEGIDIGEMPSYELVPGAKATKRPATEHAAGQPQKKKFGPRPRFEPVHFVVSTVEDDKQFQVNKKAESDTSSHGETQPNPDCNASSTVNDHSETEANPEPPMANEESKSDSSNFMTRMEQDYSAKFESHNSNMSKDFRSNVLDSWNDINKQGRKGIGFVKAPKKPGEFGREMASSSAGSANHVLYARNFINQLSAFVKAKLKTSQAGFGTRPIHYANLLNQSVQACKANPEYIYVPVKDIPPNDLPKLPKSQYNGFACEVRCQNIYLATSYSSVKLGARNKAAESAVKLLAQPKVNVVSVQRKFSDGYREDLVACDSDSPQNISSPALKQDDYYANKRPLAGPQPPKSTKSWSEFTITENADNAICILNNSAAINRMTVDYKYDKLPNDTWRCRVLVQDHCVAEACGSKKTSKTAAAKQAVQILKKAQPNQQKCAVTPFKDILIYEDEGNAISTLNITAQFNKVSIEYVIEKVTGKNCKCQVFIEQELVGEATDLKETVKLKAAKAAVEALKKTHPVVVNHAKEVPEEGVISRDQMQEVCEKKVYKPIKEDNVGNRLLRKMGWTGGGLGKEGDGIAEPVAVTEKFNRAGLGLTEGCEEITKKGIEKVIRNYVESNSPEDLKFSRELTKTERKLIHQIATKYKLKNKSYGKGTERFVVVSRKWNQRALIQQLRQDGQVGSYTLVRPDP